MTEQEWLASADPVAMLRCLEIWNIGETPPVWQMYPPTARKLRLFACACCRQAWDGEECPACLGNPFPLPDDPHCDRCGGTGRVGGLTDPRSRRAVEVAERYADGLATEEELSTALRRGHDACLAGHDRSQDEAEATHFAHALCRPALDVPHLLAGSEFGRPPPAVQAALIRCVIGNPWRPAVPGFRVTETPEGHVIINTTGDIELWRKAPAVQGVARTIHDERRPADLPILADALEEAGCDDAGLLAHLRGWDCLKCGGKKLNNVGHPDGPIPCMFCPPHALPGCHVVDLILGKE